MTHAMPSSIENRKARIDSLAYLTPDLPGIGGVIRQRTEDFLVEEQPLYQPAGEGEHVYLYIEKRDMPTLDAARRVAKAFSVRRGAVGYAGLKDKRAITRQHFSVHLPQHGGEDAAVARLAHHPNLTILWVDRHTNKLRRSHHAGNRFVIRIRNVDAADAVKAKRVIDRLQQIGAPNYVGEQRFGYRHNGDELGRLMLQQQYREMLDLMLGGPSDDDSPPLRAGRAAYEAGDYIAALGHWPRRMRYERQAIDALRQGKSHEEAVAAIDRSQHELIIHSWQSRIFNAVLDRRIRDGRFDRLVVGDVAMPIGSRGIFPVDAATAELENAPGGRMPKLEVSPTGPLWGTEMPRAGGEPDAIEIEMLEAGGIGVDELGRVGDTGVHGRRRAMRIKLGLPELSGGADEHGPYVKLAFDLPPGSFATMILREVMKTGAASSLPDES